MVMSKSQSQNVWLCLRQVSNLNLKHPNLALVEVYAALTAILIKHFLFTFLLEWKLQVTFVLPLLADMNQYQQSTPHYNKKLSRHIVL